jgi:hypothetical protein
LHLGNEVNSLIDYMDQSLARGKVPGSRTRLWAKACKRFSSPSYACSPSDESDIKHNRWCVFNIHVYGVFVVYGLVWERRFPTLLESVAFVLVVLSVMSCIAVHGREASSGDQATVLEVPD